MDAAVWWDVPSGVLSRGIQVLGQNGPKKAVGHVWGAMASDLVDLVVAHDISFIWPVSYDNAQTWGAILALAVTS